MDTAGVGVDVIICPLNIFRNTSISHGMYTTSELEKKNNIFFVWCTHAYVFANALTFRKLDSYPSLEEVT